MMLKRLSVFCFVLLFSARAWSVTAETIQDMNIGTYIQTDTTANGVLAYSSSVSNLSGMVAGSSSSPISAVVRLTGSKGKENVNITMQTASVILADTIGCTIEAQSFSFPSSTITLQNNSYDLDIGTTISISGGFCQEGTYSATATIELSGKETATANFTVQVTIEAPLSIEEITGMNFGTILSPLTASTITLKPSGNYTTTGDITFVNSALKPGEFTVTGVGNRLISISLPSSTMLSNGTQTITVDNFTSDPVGSFVLQGTGIAKTQSVKVGGTLHISPHQHTGHYTGTYPIIVSY